MRALETVEAYKFLCENHKNMFAGLNLNKLALVGSQLGC